MAGREEIPHIQGKEQRLRFAEAAMKRYHTSKVRENQVKPPYGLTIPLLGIYSEEIKIEKEILKKGTVFIAALFIIARTWKQPRCPSADKWIRKVWYMYMMEYYSAIKKNTCQSVLMRWMKLEPIIQSEVSQRNTNTVY